MTFPELISLVCLAAIVWFWLDGMRAKEIARSISAQNCRSKAVHFLDDTVVQTRVRIRRNSRGRLVLYREYGFEFTSDGTYRYRGRISLLGKQPDKFEMEAYREDYSDSRLLH